jgi:hypothetical protein
MCIEDVMVYEDIVCVKERRRRCVTTRIEPLEGHTEDLRCLSNHGL